MMKKGEVRRERKEGGGRKREREKETILRRKSFQKQFRKGGDKGSL